MALLAGIRQTFSSYVSPHKPAASTTATTATGRPLTPPTSDLDGETLIASKKRPLAAKSSPGTSRKRQKNNDHVYTPENDEDSDFEGVTLETSTPPPTKARATTSKDATDRELMPPPASPAFDVPLKIEPLKTQPRRSSDFRIYNDEEDGLLDEETFTSQTAIKRNGPKEVVEFDQQKALRYAEAMTLPETGGAWAEAEKDLFFRLAFRGFEPLVPGNWTTDFQTLPSSLFSVAGGDPPLIQSNLQREFRAIHALRTLFSIGTIIRDRAMSRYRLRPEPVLRRTLAKYICWALADVGLHSMQRPNAIPVHAIASMKKGQTTQATITAISDKLHRLANRFRAVYGVRDSIEPRDSASVTSGGSGNEESKLPILTGLIICSSLVIIVTLNSGALHPENIEIPGHRRDSNDESGLRFMATVDFSEENMDVWNALAIAICVMRIRKTMLELCERGEANGENGKGGLWERVNAKGAKRESDPDA